jgi:hypothetical protein
MNNVLEGVTLLPEAMPNDTSHAGVFLYGTYNDVLRNLQVGLVQLPYQRWDLSIGLGVYTTTIDSVYGQQLQIASPSSSNRVTTITVTGGSWTFVSISNALVVNFRGTAIQGPVEVGYQANRIQVTDSYNIDFGNVDIEGDGTVFRISGSKGVHIHNCNVAVPGSYASRGTQYSTFFNISSSSQVYSRDNVFMNWTSGPGSPRPGTYFVDGGGNAQLQLYDGPGPGLPGGAYYLGASYHAPAGQTLTSNSFSIVNFDAQDFDTDSTVTTGRAWHFTAPGIPAVKRTYHVHASVQVNAGASDVAYIGIFKNGVECKRAGTTPYGGSVTLSVDADVPCNGADTLDVRVYSNNPSPAVQASPNLNTISVVRQYGS